MASDPGSDPTPVSSEGAGPTAGPLVEVRGVSKNFGGVRALRDVSVAFGRGTVHGLVGENGAGKSTLAKAIGGVHQPNEGEILVDGEPVRVPVAARRAGRAASPDRAGDRPRPPGLGRGERVPRGLSATAGMVDRRALRTAYRALDERVGFGLIADATSAACAWPSSRRSRSCARSRATRG